MPIILVFALPQEAEPWLQSDVYTMQWQQKNIKWYKGNRYDILITGMGMLHMSMAIASVQVHYTKDTVWVNLGCAGGPTHALHQWHQIISLHTNIEENNFYPTIINKAFALAHGYTQTTAANDTQIIALQKATALPTLVDMEAYAFVAAVKNFYTHTQALVLKWVSDDGTAAFYKNPEWKTNYAKEKNAIDNFINTTVEKIKANRQTYMPSVTKYLDEIKTNWPITKSQTIQLQHALLYAQGYKPVATISQAISQPLIAQPNKIQTKKVVHQIIEKLYYE
jgi:purine-nucleoside phosphorylase